MQLALVERCLGHQFRCWSNTGTVLLKVIFHIFYTDFSGFNCLCVYIEMVKYIADLLSVACGV